MQATAETAAASTTKEFRQVFTVSPLVTVYIRASHCEVSVYRHPGNSVEVLASLRAAFGWEFVSEQDEVGVYIVARRKPVVGALSYARFDVTAPPEANLVLHLTPGDVRFANIDGKFSVPTLEVKSH